VSTPERLERWSFELKNPEGDISQAHTHMADGTTKVIRVARADWQFVMLRMREGYISWEQFEANQRRRGRPGIR
jgi:hypothetical protein